MFSHVISLNPLSGVNLQSLHNVYRPRQESTPKPNFEPLELAKNPSICRTSSLGTNMTVSQLPEKKINKAHSQPKGVSSPSYQSETFSSGKRPKFAQADDYFTIIEENDQNMAQKKVKTEKESLFFNLHSKAEAITSLIDEIDVSLLERHSTDKFQPSSAFGAGFNYCGTSSVSTTVDRSLSSPSEVSSVSESTYPFLSNAHNYLFNIDFGSLVDTLDQHCYTLPTNFLSMTETDDCQIIEKMVPSQKQLALQECLTGISESDIQRLVPERYLNDSIINFYLKLIETGFLTEERKKKCHFFNTYFMARMRQLFSEINNDFSNFDIVYEKMEKWTKKINIFEKDFLFFPVHENEHWSLVVLCYPQRLLSDDGQMPYVIFLDSLCRMDNIYAAILFQFFSREIRTRKPQEFNAFQFRTNYTDKTSFPYYQQFVPKQNNMTDCGLYLLQYVEMFAEDESFIIENKEDLNKVKWFPRKLIQEKRQNIKKIIEDISAGRFETIDQYITKRNSILRDSKKKASEFNSFNKPAFDQTFASNYAGLYISPEDQQCLMLDFYYADKL